MGLARPTGPYWAFTWLYWDLMGLTGTYWDLPGLIGTFWALLDLNGPY